MQGQWDFTFHFNFFCIFSMVSNVDWWQCIVVGRLVAFWKKQYVLFFLLSCAIAVPKMAMIRLYELELGIICVFLPSS